MKRLTEWAGDIKIDYINRNKIEKFLAYLRDTKEYNVISINMYLRQLKVIFQRAVDEYNYIKTHPFRSIKPFAVARGTSKAVFLTSEQITFLWKILQIPT